MDNTKELKAICKICNIVIFSYPEPYVYDIRNV
jgi:hypothetical protein